MTDRHLILSTCGTSLLTNLADRETRKRVVDHANTVDPESIPHADRNALQALISSAQTELESADDQHRAQLSAELNGLFRLGRELGASNHQRHWLIATDTWLGQETAECIANMLQRQGHQVDVRRIPGLRTDSRESFRNAVVELARLCAQEVKGERDGGSWITFNLTGGFKAVQGFMQALGMLYADETVYVFERTDKLLHIPRLPVELNALDIVRKYRRVFSRMSAGLPVSVSSLAEMPKTLYEQADDLFDLSVWGQALWQEAKRTLLEEQLWPPISDKIRFGRNFEKTVYAVCAQQKDRIRIINERLMDLARYLEENTFNPTSLDFKKLKGKHPPWTHEFDAWSDRDARRIYGYFEGKVFVLGELGKHL